MYFYFAVALRIGNRPDDAGLSTYVEIAARRAASTTVKRATITDVNNVEVNGAGKVVPGSSGQIVDDSYRPPVAHQEISGA